MNTVNGLFSYVEGLRALPWTAWKGETAAFIHRSLRHEPRRTFFFVMPGCLPLHLREWSVWLRGLTKLRKSQMSEKIISVCESSSDFPQIPFHSGKEWMFSAKEEEKTINGTWQVKHPVWSKRFQHTFRTEPMPNIYLFSLAVTRQWNASSGLLYQGSHKGALYLKPLCSEAL